VKSSLDKDQWALYKLIWDRFVASPDAFSRLPPDHVEIKADNGVFTSVGTVPVFQGFMALYVEGEDDQENGNGEKKLPSLTEGQVLELLGLAPKQHFNSTALPVLGGDVD